MKRLLNDGYDAVEELLDGYVKAHGDVVKLADNERVVVRTTLSPQPKVGHHLRWWQRPRAAVSGLCR